LEIKITVERDIWPFILGILGYAEDCDSNVELLARKISSPKELKIWKVVPLSVLWTICRERTC
jgi:hypothetical protein